MCVGCSSSGSVGSTAEAGVLSNGTDPVTSTVEPSSVAASRVGTAGAALEWATSARPYCSWVSIESPRALVCVAPRDDPREGPFTECASPELSLPGVEPSPPSPDPSRAGVPADWSSPPPGRSLDVPSEASAGLVDTLVEPPDSPPRPGSASVEERDDPADFGPTASAAPAWCESPVSANATALPEATAAPIPRATANPPTRPMYAAAFIGTVIGHQPRCGKQIGQTFPMWGKYFPHVGEMPWSVDQSDRSRQDTSSTPVGFTNRSKATTRTRKPKSNCLSR